MKDLLLDETFNPERWSKFIQKESEQDINKRLYSLCSPKTRALLCMSIREGKYSIAPPHIVCLPKDIPEEFSIKYINNPIDHILLGLTSDALFEFLPELTIERNNPFLCGGMVDKTKERLSMTTYTPNEKNAIGFKFDLSKYFNSVPLVYIDKVFDDVEKKFYNSMLLNVIRKYYHSDWYFASDGQLKKMQQGLKFGCPMANWLSDVIFKHIDEKLLSINGYYIRFLDYIVFIGPDFKIAMDVLNNELEGMQIKCELNDFKYLTHN
jgi:RNA-directed DNA polymerase